MSFFDWHFFHQLLLLIFKQQLYSIHDKSRKKLQHNLLWERMLIINIYECGFLFFYNYNTCIYFWLLSDLTVKFSKLGINLNRIPFFGHLSHLGDVLKMVFLSRRKLCVNKFTFLSSSWNLQDQLLQFLGVDHIYRKRKLNAWLECP